MIEASESKVSAVVMSALKDVLDLYSVDLAFRYMGSLLQVFLIKFINLK